MSGLFRGAIISVLALAALPAAGWAGAGAKERSAPPPARRAAENGEASRADLLDGLLARLYLAGSDPEARVIAESIREIWLKAGTDTAVVLIRQADRALRAGAGETALRILDLVTRRWPDYAEGWRQRGAARYLLGDAKGALRDLDRALALEPRQFEALLARMIVLRDMKRDAAALEACREVLLIYPGMEAARRACKALRLKLDRSI